jgi:tetratricopeptide (TPR) repeat protein
MARTRLGDLASAAGRSPEEDYGAADRDFARALEINPSRSETWMHLGVLHVHWANRSGDGAPPHFATARRSFERARTLSPKDPTLWIERGMGYYNEAFWKKKRGQMAVDEAREALASLEEAVQLDPTLEPGLRERMAGLRKYIGPNE